VLSQLFRQGILPDFEPAVLSVKNGKIEMSAAQGTIYYTLDGTDPRMIGGKPSPTAKVYKASFEPDQAIQIKSRVIYRNEWSTLSTLSN
jgi:hypothetical protein